MAWCSGEPAEGCGEGRAEGSGGSSVEGLDDRTVSRLVERSGDLVGALFVGRLDEGLGDRSFEGRALRELFLAAARVFEAFDGIRSPCCPNLSRSGTPITPQLQALDGDTRQPA